MCKIFRRNGMEVRIFRRDDGIDDELILPSSMYAAKLCNDEMISLIDWLIDWMDDILFYFSISFFLIFW